MNHTRRQKKRPRLRPGLTPTVKAKAASSGYPQPLAPSAPIQLHLDGQTTPATWPSVSVCMIVKNEEKNLAACLTSLGDLPAEIIIVDTGSTDRTVEIACAGGAQVKHFNWLDDFAAARNESIREARGDWIFWLDADDRISPENLNRLKQALVSNQADVYGCRVVSQGMERGTVNTTTLHWRLFRHHLGLQFHYPLHETVAFATAQHNLIIAASNITIEHTGYALDKQALQAKARRNLSIIEQCLAREPDNLHWQYHQAVSLFLLAEYGRAAAAFEAVVAKPPLSLSREVDLYQAHTALVAAYTKINRPERARQALARARKLFPKRRHLAITAGMFYLDQDEPEQAVRMLEQARSLPSESDALGHAWPAATLEKYLSLAYLLSGNLEAATHALKLLNLAAFTDPAELRTRAYTQRQHQHWDNVVVFLGQAIALSQPQLGELARLAAAVILKTGQTHTAERLCRLALAQNRADTAARSLLNLVSQHPRGLWPRLIEQVKTLLTVPTHAAARHRLHQMAQALDLPLPDLLRVHGRRLLNERDYVHAAETFSLLLNLAPHEVEAYKALAVALHGLGHEAEAILAWQTGQRFEQQQDLNP